MGLIADIHKDLENGALQLIVEYSERLHALAVKMCGDEAQAEDLVFRTFERVLTKAKTYKSDTNLFGWMKSIMENIHKDDLKRPVARNTTTVEAEELEQYAGADWSTDEQLLKNSDSEALREALRGLDPKYNQVLLMRYYQEFSMKQIANILQLPLGTVTRRVQIAHQILAGKLRAEFGKVKKPLAVLLAALLGVGSLFGAWKAAETIWPEAFSSAPEEELITAADPLPQQEEKPMADALPTVGPENDEPTAADTVRDAAQAEPPPATDLKEENKVTSEQVNTEKAEREDAMNGKKLMMAAIAAASAALGYGEPVRQSIDPSPYDGNVYVGADREGEWSVASNWSYGHVPTEGEDVFIVDRIVAASGPISVNSLTIKEGGVLAVQAAAAKTPADLPSIFDDATQVTVAGELRVESGARLRPICDALTGAPVVFRVGSFTLDFGGRVWCDDAGFVWVKCDEAPEGAYTDKNGEDTYCTYAPGRGTDTEHGGAYGCAGANPAYGSAYAPFLPGAPGTCRAGSANVASYNFGGRGGGAFVLLSSGTVSLSGDVTCRSVDCTKCSGAGGGIWIVGSDFKVAPCARLVADSGMSTSRATDYAGTGGRISLAANLLDADIAALVRGETPDDLNYTNTLDFVSASVQAGRGGLNATTGERVTASRPGTLSYVTRGDGSYVTEIPAPIVPRPVYPDPAGDGLARTFVGTDGGDWDDPANWSPAGVPGDADPVTIDGKWVVAYGIVHAASLSIAADACLTVGGTLRDITAQKPFADSTGFGLKIAGDLTVAGDLSVGGSDSPVPVLITVGGDATVEGGGRLAVYAANASGFDRQTLYDEATVFDVAGAFNIDAGATVYPDADPRTGAPVRFKAQTILLAAGGAINADRRGYDFVSVAIMDRATFFSDGGFSLIEGKMTGSFTPGTGVETDAGGGYGANGDRAGALGGVHYGFDAAPFQPGAPSGHYYGIGPVRGGGAVWLDAMQVTLGGTITANGTCGTYGQSSGGGVWIVAKAVVTSVDAVIHADGGAEGVCNFTALSSGGRVALGLSLTAEEEAALVAGTTPETVTAVEGVVGFTATVNGGSKNSGALRGQTGTIRTVTGTYVPDTSVTVVGSPKNAVSPAFSYGASIVTAGSVFALPTIGYGSDPDDPLARYPYGGWVLTDEDGKVIESGKEGVSFTVPQGNTTLTILWKNKESGTLVSVPDATLGAVSVGGVSHDADFTYFITGSAEFTAVPASGAEFLYWVGEVPAGHQLDNPLTIAAGVGRRIQPVFRTAAAATVRAWTGAAGNGLWLDAANWSPEGVPGLDDDAAIASGSVIVTNFVHVKNLSLSGAARLLAGTTEANGPYVDPVIEEVAVEITGALALSDSSFFALGGQDEDNPSRKPRLAAGSIRLSGASVLAVTAGAVGEAGTFETGCGTVTVTGMFELAGSAQFVPASDQYTGGSLVVRPGRFVLGAEAMVNAEGRGFDYRQFKDPKIIAPGQGYGCDRGAGYGGKGGFAFGNYGQTYGFGYAPIHPGSCSGIYASGNVYPAGGLIRIHAKSAVLNGTLNAKPLMGYYGGSSGGGIWVTTSGKMGIGATFAALLGGGSSNTGADGGGGRIALGEWLTDAEVAKLAADGEVPLRGSRQKPIPVLTQKEFESLYPGATIDLTAGGSHGQPGTFAFLNGTTKGFILTVR